MIDYDPDRHFDRIGETTQVFLNDDMITWVKNVKRTYHKAKPHEANPLIVKNRPWEEMPYFTSCYSVLQDDDGSFKAWYSDFVASPPYERPLPIYSPPAWSSRLCYAVSEDGVDFEKPLLGQVEIDGENTNIVGWNEDVDVGVAYSVIRDPTETDPSRRLKMTYLPVKLNGNIPKRSTVANPDEMGLAWACSGDGINWTPFAENPVELVWGSDVQMLTYDDEQGRYVIYGRCHYAAESGNPRGDNWFSKYYPSQPSGWVPKRAIYRIESEDLVFWSNPKRVLAPGDSHNLDDQFYGLPTFRMGKYYCGLLPVLHGVDNTVDSEFVYSKDGFEWAHFPRAGPLIDRGGEGSWDEFMITTAVPPIRVEDRLHIYYGGSASHHDWWAFSSGQGLETEEAEPGYRVRHGLGLATIRADGFVSLAAGLREGRICTKPFFSTGANLVINGRCEPGGYIAAEILDIFEEPWKGFEREDCVPFTGDDVDHVFAWKSGHDINMIPGYTRICFHMRNAQLFSFRVTDDD